MHNDDLPDIPDCLDRRTPEQKNNPGNVRSQPGPEVSASKGADNNEKSEAPEKPSAVTDLKPHPYADMFPHMQDEDFKGLVASIRKDGLEEPIVTYEGKILDGRNRYAACAEAAVKPTSIEYEGTDPLEFVLRKNLHRRQLQTSQRAMVAAKMANLKNGQRADEVSGTSIDVAAKAFNVGRASVDRARIVLARGDEELIRAVENGEKSISAAAKQVAQATKPATPPFSDDEVESQRLLKLWVKTGKEGQKLFLKAIGAAT
jgi:ParB-like chromosome segregation protein Spo0J